MELNIAHLINLLLVSVFVGTEFSIGFLVHPVLSKLPQSVHISSVQVIGRRVGRVMPFWIPLIIVSGFPVLYFTWEIQGLTFWFTVAGLSCIVTMLAISLLGNVPINKQVISWDPESPPDDWLRLRKRWDNLHQIRILLDVIALICFLLGVLL